MKIKWFGWLLIGIVLRVIISVITLHPDLWGHSFVAYFFAYEGVLNPYEHLLSLSQDHPLVVNFGVSDIFIYPPLTYYTFGLFRLIVKPFVDPNFIPWLMENVGNAHQYGQISWILFLFKLPYIFIDIATAFLISGLFKKDNLKKLGFILWMLNPVTLYATFMMGQFDILPVLFTILSVYLFKNEKYSWSLISLGIGGSYKIYPLLFVIPAAILAGKTFRSQVKYFSLGIAPFILTALPFLGSAAFKQMVLFSPKSQKMLFMIWKLTAAEGIYPFILILVGIYWYVYHKKQSLKLENVMLAILLLIFSITHYHPQWFLWVTPFLIMAVVKNRNVKAMTAVLLWSWIYVVLMFDTSLNIGLFHILNPNLKDAVSLGQLLSKYTDIAQLSSMVRRIASPASQQRI